MAYQPYIRQPIARARVAGIRRPSPPPPGVRRVGLGGYPLAGLGDDLATAQALLNKVPFVGGILSSVAGPLASIVDPGKKRDASREARAKMYEQLALNGSLTAANRVYSAAVGIHGGAGPTKEANWYKTAWQNIQAQIPELAAKVLTLPRVGLPDPQAPTLSPADTQLIQGEINAYHGLAQTATRTGQQALAGIPGGTTGLLLIAAVGLAFLKGRR